MSAKGSLGVLEGCEKSELSSREFEIPRTPRRTTGKGQQFKNGRHPTAYLGLVLGPSNTGNKTVILPITKRGLYDTPASTNTRASRSFRIG
jgi:hypothetical protein